LLAEQLEEASGAKAQLEAHVAELSSAGAMLQAELERLRQQQAEAEGQQAALLADLERLQVRRCPACPATALAARLCS
jgi:hypothetical protein